MADSVGYRGQEVGGRNRQHGDEAQTVVYRMPHVGGRHRTHGDFIVFCEPGMVDKWRSNKEGVSVSEVVQQAKVFEKTASSQPMHPSKQTLESVFGTSNNMQVIEYILEHGQIHGGSKHQSSSSGGDNNKNIFLG